MKISIWHWPVLTQVDVAYNMIVRSRVVASMGGGGGEVVAHVSLFFIITYNNVPYPPVPLATKFNKSSPFLAQPNI